MFFFRSQNIYKMRHTLVAHQPNKNITTNHQMRFCYSFNWKKSSTHLEHKYSLNLYNYRQNYSQISFLFRHTHIHTNNMMHSKRRKIPVEVSVWTQKDVTVQKPTVSSGMMPDDTRLNVFCRRKFHDNLLNLSFERQRNIARRDFDTKKFLKRQREKAEKSMPGLLP